VPGTFITGSPEFFLPFQQKVENEFALPLDPIVEQLNQSHEIMYMWDQWTQDLFETGYMSMPSPSGQQVMRVFYRTPAWSDEYSLRTAGKIVFTKFRGPDVAGVQQNGSPYGSHQTLNSFGNWETIPPHSPREGVDYPFGRLFYGTSDSLHPDEEFRTMIEAQGWQPPVTVDTTFLCVGHVDEIFSFVRSGHKRGWTIAVADPELAVNMLKDLVAEDPANGNATFFDGQSWIDPIPYWPVELSASKTINQILAAEQLLSDNDDLKRLIETQLGHLLTETGIKEPEVLRVPVLFFTQTLGSGRICSVAYQPDTVNGAFLTPADFVAPEPHGPIIAAWADYQWRRHHETKDTRRIRP